MTTPAVVERDEVSTFDLLAPFIIEKMDADQQVVEGYASRPGPDMQGEDIDADAWPQSVLDEYMEFPTLRAQHDKTHVAGKVLAIKSTAKGLWIKAHVVDPVDWLKVKSGAYPGFSIRGNVAPGGRDPKDKKHITKMKFLEEISLVDKPAKKDALIEVIKMADANQLEDLIQRIAARPDKSEADKTRAEAEFGGGPFADEKNKAYPIHDAAHVRNAASRWGDAKNRAKYSAADQKTITARIEAAKKKFGIGDEAEKMQASGADVIEKGMWNLQSLASILGSLKNLYDSQVAEEAAEEDTESPLPDLLAQVCNLIGSLLVTMASEETGELLGGVMSTEAQKKAMEKANELLKAAGLAPITEDTVVQKGAKVSKGVFNAAMKDSIQDHKDAIAAHKEAIAEHGEIKDKAEKMDDDEDHAPMMKEMQECSKAAFKGATTEKVQKLADLVEELKTAASNRIVQKSADAAAGKEDAMLTLISAIATRMDAQGETIQKMADGIRRPARASVLLVDKDKDATDSISTDRKGASKEDILVKMKDDKLSVKDRLKMLMGSGHFTKHSQVLDF